MMYTVSASNVIALFSSFPWKWFTCEYPLHFAIVPQILKDALHVTSQSIEAEMARTLKLAFEYTGEIVVA